MATSPIRHLELLQLRQKDDNGQSVDKAKHDRMRHHANELAQFEDTGSNLDQSHQDHRGEQIFDPVVRDQRHHDHRQRARRARDHARPTAKHGGDQSDDERRIKPDQRLHPRHKGKGDGFRYQRQGHGQSRQNIGSRLRRGQVCVPGRKAQMTGEAGKC